MILVQYVIINMLLKREVYRECSVNIFQKQLRISNGSLMHSTDNICFISYYNYLSYLSVSVKPRNISKKGTAHNFIFRGTRIFIEEEY